MSMKLNKTLLKDWRSFIWVIGLLLLAITISCKQKAGENIIESRDFTFKESNVVGRHNADRAFDKSIAPDNFWESTNFPIWLQLDSAKSKKIIKYVFHIGEDATRTPKDWRFQGSNDGTSWTDLDTQANQTNWKSNEERFYNISNPGNYKIYRFYFTLGIHPEILRIYEIKVFE